MSFTISPIVTQGFGVGNMIVTLGYGPISQVTRIVRGGRSAAKKIYENYLDEFKITVMLLEVNNSELVRPIVSKRTYKISDDDASVKIETVKVQKKQKRIFNVIANLLRTIRGKDADD